jgi:hypothetical protein
MDVREHKEYERVKNVQNNVSIRMRGIYLIADIKRAD